MTIATLKQKIQTAQVTRDLLAKKIDTRAVQIQDSGIRLKGLEEAQALVQLAAMETQNQLKFHLEDLVQHAIESLFPGKYQFKVEFEIQRDRTAASMFLESDGQPLDPMDECGGTVVQVVAFALRVAAWTLAPTDNVILMDEPFAAVSSDFRAVCGELLSGLSKRLGIQFIVVASHESGQSYLVDYADRVFEVTQDKDGRSHVTVKEGKVE